MKKQTLQLIALTSAMALIGCGGGGSSSPSAPPSSNAPATSSAASSSSTLTTSSSTSSAINSSADSSTSSSIVALKDLADFPIGVAVSAGQENFSITNDAKQQAVVAYHFDQMTAGNIMKMSYLHPQQNTYTYTTADALVEWGQANGLGMHGHALIWHSSYQVPAFLNNFTGSPQDFLTLIAEHSKNITAHYFGKVDSWDVVNEAFLDNGQYRSTGSEGSIFYQKAGGKDYIATAFRAAREGDSTADLYYNDYNTEQNGAKTNAMITMVKELLADGVPITGIGYQMHVMIDWPSISDIKAALKKAADLGLMVKITELDIPINHSWSDAYRNGTVHRAFTPALAQQQKARYCEIVKAYMEAVPAAQRGGITVWGVADHHSWLMDLMFKNEPQDIVWPLLFDKDLNAKPALYGVADALSGKSCSN